jgi:hypothetical protein
MYSGVAPSVVAWFAFAAAIHQKLHDGEVSIL